LTALPLPLPSGLLLPFLSFVADQSIAAAPVETRLEPESRQEGGTGWGPISSSTHAPTRSRSCGRSHSVCFLFFFCSHHHDAPRRLLLLIRQSNHTLTLAAAGAILHRSSAVPVMDDIGAFLPSASYCLPSFVYFSCLLCRPTNSLVLHMQADRGSQDFILDPNSPA